jgi:uncharacterized membrane protein YqaE (UPF0057 family)
MSDLKRSAKESMNTPASRQEEEHPSNAKGRSQGIFTGALIVWSLLLCLGTFVSGPVSAQYGALTVGAMFGVAAMCTGALSTIFALMRFRDWRRWLAVALCCLALLSTMAHAVRHSGP